MGRQNSGLMQSGYIKKMKIQGSSYPRQWHSFPCIHGATFLRKINTLKFHMLPRIIYTDHVFSNNKLFLPISLYIYIYIYIQSQIIQKLFIKIHRVYATWTEAAGVEAVMVAILEPWNLSRETEENHTRNQSREFTGQQQQKVFEHNNVGIYYCHAQLVYIIYFILAMCFDPIQSSSGQ